MKLKIVPSQRFICHSLKRLNKYANNSFYSHQTFISIAISLMGYFDIIPDFEKCINWLLISYSFVSTYILDNRANYGFFTKNRDENEGWIG